MKSVIQTERRCFLCGRNGNGDPLEEHHIFPGKPNRKHSEADGMKVFLCGNECHRNGKKAVHRNRETDSALKEHAQAVWESLYGKRDDFRKRYGKSYL